METIDVGDTVRGVFIDLATDGAFNAIEAESMGSGFDFDGRTVTILVLAACTLWLHITGLIHTVQIADLQTEVKKLKGKGVTYARADD